MPATPGVHTYLTTNARNLAIRQVHRSEVYLSEIRDAVRDGAREVIKKAKQFSQRQFFTLKELERMGHPFRKARWFRPRGYAVHRAMKPYIINRHSGALYRGWRFLTQLVPGGDGWRFIVYNTADHSKYMKGTVRMIERPILEEAVRRTRQRRAMLLHMARNKAVMGLGRLKVGEVLPSAPTPRVAGPTPLRKTGPISGYYY